MSLFLDLQWFACVAYDVPVVFVEGIKVHVSNNSPLCFEFFVHVKKRLQVYY